MTNIIKATGKTAADLAREAAKRVAREPLEILKSAAPPGLRLSGSESPQLQGQDTSNLISDAISATSLNAEANVNAQELNAQAKRRLGELEQEIQRIRQERAQKIEAWNKEQQALLDQGKSGQQKQSLIEPQSKKKRGFMGFMKKKQGTKELGKQMSS